MPPGMGPPTARVNVVTIATDEGIDGHVFVTGPGVDVTPQSSVPRSRCSSAATRSTSARSGTTSGLRARMFDPTVQGYVDIALWDIAGKAAGLPVHRMLGTARRSVALVRLVVGAPQQRDLRRRGVGVQGEGSSGTSCIRRPSAGACPSAGHPGRCRSRRTSTRARRFARRSASDDADARRIVGVHVQEALYVGMAIEELDYHWYEDPLAPRTSTAT